MSTAGLHPDLMHFHLDKSLYVVIFCLFVAVLILFCSRFQILFVVIWCLFVVVCICV